MSKRSQVKTARLGHIEAQGATVQEAKANLAPMVERACSLPQAVLETRFGLVLFVIPTPTGWNTGVFDPARMANGARPCLGSFCGPIDYCEALESTRMHAAQNAWRHNSDDCAHIEAAGLTPAKARDLARWIRFQREYARLNSFGSQYTESEKHRLACEASWQPPVAMESAQ